MGMKFLPIVLTLSCATLLLPGCGRPAAGPSDTDEQIQERIEEQEAHRLSELHEREAALDERERLLAQREQQLTIASAPAPAQLEQAQQPQPVEAPPQPDQPVPPAASAPAPMPAAPSPEASYQAFYDALSPYGTWVQVPGYGFLWQPAATVQDPLWRPYTLGHWVFTDEGWTWVSDEPFGWITYHYGRWMRTRTLGWVWTPGEQWAPAWVSWRYGGDFAGWAPLPPEASFDGGSGIQQWADQQYNLGPSDYTWVPAAEFGDDSMADEEVPPDQAGTLYDDSNNITNIYYDTAAYAIVCYGPNYDFMRSKSHRPLLPPCKLRRNGFRPGGHNGATVSGNILDVAAPRVNPHSATTSAPRTLRGLVADTRLINLPGSPPAPGPQTGAPPYQPQRTPSGIPPMKTNPAAAPRPGAGVAGWPATPGAPPDIPDRSRINPAPVPSDTEALEAQKARELAVIQQQQADRERQIAEAARRAAQEQSAQEAARAQRAAAEETAHAAAAARQSQVSHASSLPAGTQPPGRGQ